MNYLPIISQTQKTSYRVVNQQLEKSLGEPTKLNATEMQAAILPLQNNLEELKQLFPSYQSSKSLYYLVTGCSTVLTFICITTLLMMKHASWSSYGVNTGYCCSSGSAAITVCCAVLAFVKRKATMQVLTAIKDQQIWLAQCLIASGALQQWFKNLGSSIQVSTDSHSFNPDWIVSCSVLTKKHLQVMIRPGDYQGQTDGFIAKLEGLGFKIDHKSTQDPLMSEFGRTPAKGVLGWYSSTTHPNTDAHRIGCFFNPQTGRLSIFTKSDIGSK